MDIVIHPVVCKKCKRTFYPRKKKQRFKNQELSLRQWCPDCKREYDLKYTGWKGCMGNGVIKKYIKHQTGYFQAQGGFHSDVHL